MQWARVRVTDAELEVLDLGAGEPVVLVQTALTADEFLPVAQQPVLRDGFRIVLYHRRGYGGSSPVHGPGSIARDAADCRQLLDVLGIPRAHIIGLSYSCAVAMQLAATSPERVHSICLIEPPPVHTASADDFRAANAELADDRRRHGPAVALDNFLRRVIGDEWRTDLAAQLPGSVAQAERDADIFFSTDLPALLSWRFGEADARRIRHPVLHIGGTDSGPWFAEVRELVLTWFPQAYDRRIDGADHSLALTHAPQVATELAAFLRLHPIRP